MSENLEIEKREETPAAVSDSAESAAKSKPKKCRRRFGDRKDGRRVRTISPMQRVSAYIMKNRNGSTNLYEGRIDMGPVDRYIRMKKEQGMANFSVMHVIVAAYIRVVSQLPALNRFISGREVYSRDEIQVAITIKREMTTSSPDTVLKLHFQPDATADTVYEVFTREIDAYRNAPGGDFDQTAKVLSHMPGFVMRIAVKLLTALDYVGWLPKFLTDLSPFHGSMFITSMGSLGISTIYHHLYDFGNMPVFISFGKKEHLNELDADGVVRRKSYVSFTVVMDERICDGFYYATALKQMMKLFKNPSELDLPPETIVEDIP
ncbi:MAG: hypothetical protein J5938_05000 [Clostridia bacterium]|nr:hypothetical protein [Clostridia bacterium]